MQIYYALDFGGTNFRVVRTHLKGNARVRFSQHKLSLLSAGMVSHLSKGLLDPKATATQMFDFFTAACKEFMTQEEDFKTIPDNDSSLCQKFQAGFTFSFPCSQRSINSAILMEWTKGFETGSVNHCISTKWSLHPERIDTYHFVFVVHHSLIGFRMTDGKQTTQSRDWM